MKNNARKVQWVISTKCYTELQEMKKTYSDRRRSTKTKKIKFEVGPEEVRSRKQMGGEGSVVKNGDKVSWRECRGNRGWRSRSHVKTLGSVHHGLDATIFWKILNFCQPTICIYVSTNTFFKRLQMVYTWFWNFISSFKLYLDTSLMYCIFEIISFSLTILDTIPRKRIAYI